MSDIPCLSCHGQTVRTTFNGEVQHTCNNCGFSWQPYVGDDTSMSAAHQPEPLWKELARNHEEAIALKKKSAVVEEAQAPPVKSFAADVFAHTYPRTIETVFKSLPPKTKTPVFSLLQALYSENPGRFRVISGIHQNSAEDTLHLSLAIECDRCSYTVHVYGFWKNYFRVTMLTLKDDDGDVETIARF